MFQLGRSWHTTRPSSTSSASAFLHVLHEFLRSQSLLLLCLLPPPFISSILPTATHTLCSVFYKILDELKAECEELMVKVRWPKGASCTLDCINASIQIAGWVLVSSSVYCHFPECIVTDSTHVSAVRRTCSTCECTGQGGVAGCQIRVSG